MYINGIHRAIMACVRVEMIDSFNFCIKIVNRRLEVCQLKATNQHLPLLLGSDEIFGCQATIPTQKGENDYQ